MSGNRYFLDTNAVIALLNGDEEICSICNESVWTGISIITVLEYLSFGKLSDEERLIFSEFMETSEIIAIAPDMPELISLITQTRAKSKLKLPDSIVAASAIYTESILLTKDRQVLCAGIVPARSW